MLRLIDTSGLINKNLTLLGCVNQNRFAILRLSNNFIENSNKNPEIEDETLKNDEILTDNST